MNIETTTCISYEHCIILKNLSKKYKLSLHSFVIDMINYVLSHKSITIKSYTQLSYRTRFSAQWKRVHLVLLEHEYEFLMDVRKVYKMSLAKMIAFCVDNYLYDFIASIEKEDNTDNYRCCGYTFQFSLEEGIPCCKFYWGPHPEILQRIA